MEIKINKVDEVYNQIQIDDRGVFNQLSEHFTFKVPGAEFMPSYRNRMWDGKIRLLNTATGFLYSGLNKYIEQFAEERGYHVSYTYDSRPIDFTIEAAKKFIDEQLVSLPPNFDQREYQIEAFKDAICNSRSLFLSPTGSGKSFIIYMIMRWHLKPTLLIVPTVTLVHQIYSDFEDYGFKSEKYCHKIYTGQSKETDKPIVITTWQSVYKLKKEWFDKFSVVIGDEAHLFKAKSCTTLMTKLVNTPYRYGFTGSLDDSQTHQLVLEGLFGPVNKVITTRELQDMNYLAKLQIKIITLKYSELTRKKNSKNKYQEEMDFLCSHEIRNKFIRDLTLSLNGNTLLLFQYVEKHGKILHESIKKMVSEDRKVYFVHGKVKGETRNEIRAIVENESDAIVIASYGTFSTGINIKNLHNIIYASPFKTKIRNLQSIGRGLRTSSTKDSATLYDIADDLSWGSKTNYTLNHLMERVKQYDLEQHEYTVRKVEIKDV
jgi:superfamily II DNA or RNA helicase